MKYLIRAAKIPPPLHANWNEPEWSHAETLEIKNFRSESSDHRPRTSARLLYDDRALHGIFHVKDRYVRCTRTNFGDEVWKDSCVEFFVQPKPDRGYFNFEFNCGGAFLCYYITDPTPTADGFKKFEKISAVVAREIKVRSTLPPRIEPEITSAVEWSLQFSIPLALLEKFVGSLGIVSGQTWRGNFFKCADECSHQHWASWSPVDEFNFHLPRCFGAIQFK